MWAVSWINRAWPVALKCSFWFINSELYCLVFHIVICSGRGSENSMPKLNGNFMNSQSKVNISRDNHRAQINKCNLNRVSMAGFAVHQARFDVIGCVFQSLEIAHLNSPWSKLFIFKINKFKELWVFLVIKARFFRRTTHFCARLNHCESRNSIFGQNTWKREMFLQN